MLVLPGFSEHALIGLHSSDEDLPIQPCFCLCRGLTQMTLRIPLRLIILHLLQIFFTDALTFIFTLLSSVYDPSPLQIVGGEFDGNFVPGRILMKCIRILPEIWARTRCPFSSSTLNMAFGSVSTTVPSTVMFSSFGHSVPLPRRFPEGSSAHLAFTKTLFHESFVMTHEHVGFNLIRRIHRHARRQSAGPSHRNRRACEADKSGSGAGRKPPRHRWPQQR